MSKKEAIYPEGIRAFSPHKSAPDFVIGTILITPKKLIEWLEDKPELFTDYKGEEQIKLQLLDGNKGLYLRVDDYKPGTAQAAPPPAPQAAAAQNDDLPF
jgi:hypothetical protein